MFEIHGEVSGSFESVADVFRDHFVHAGEVGASLCVWVRGEKVIDVWGGTLAGDAARPWEADTLVNAFSVTKGIVAATCLMLEDRGILDLDSPLASVWPEFGRDPAKLALTFRHVLNHTSGLVALGREVTLDELEAWEPVERVLEDSPLLWEPGQAQGYHAVTFGLLLRAAVERATGKSLGTWIAEEVAGPLAADVYLGLDPTLDDRVATLQTLPPSGIPKAILRPLLLESGTLEANFFRNVFFRPSSPGSRAVKHPRELGGLKLKNFNLARVRRMELPWANGHMSARGVARIYQALVNGGTLDGVRLCSPEAVRRLHEPQSWSDLDLTMRKPMGFSQGFLKEQSTLFSPSRAWFGHPGIGGSLGYADPEHGIAFGYVMNKLRPQVRSPTALALSRAVYAAIGEPVPSS